MEYRLTKDQLLEILAGWNRFLGRRTHLIACGGTAVTLAGVKASTKDVDFMVPVDREYQHLIGKLTDLGYKPVSGAGWQREGEPFQFDLFRGNRIHTTELLQSPLDDGRHILFMEYSRLYIGILNDYDLIVSKLMRGTTVDYEDCIALAKARGKQLDLDKLADHYDEMVSYDIAQDRIRHNMEAFLHYLKEESSND